MEKIVLITDSASDISKEDTEKYNIKMLRFGIILDNKVYKDGVEITSKEVYERIKDTIISTSVPTLEEIRLLYEELKSEGYTHAIFIPISSGLSSIANMINLQSKEIKEINTYIFNSKSISMGEGVQVIECAKLIKQGKTFDEIVQMLPQIRSKVSLYFIVPTLDYLIRGGRIGRVTGKVGQTFNIKPVISVGDDGKYYTVANTRGWEAATSKMISIGDKLLDEHPSMVYIRHAANEKDATYLFDHFKTHPNTKSASLGEISALAGVHSGPGLIGTVFYRID